MSEFSKEPVKDRGTSVAKVPMVAVVCMAIVQKSEYDEMGVKEILPAQVVGEDGRVLVSIQARAVVAENGQVLDKVTDDFDRIWTACNERLERATREMRSNDDD